ncbi:MAG: phage tail tape measure protein [Desulfovibrionaceae bacterium]
MPKNLALAVNISARLASSFRAAVDKAREGLRGMRSDAQRQTAAVRAGTAASGELARASALVRQASVSAGSSAAGSFSQAGNAAGNAGGQVNRLSGQVSTLPGVAREFDKAFSYAANAAENALKGTGAASELLAKKQKALHDYLKRANIEAGDRSRAEAAMRALGRRQLELRRNEEALARAMEHSNAVAEKRSRLYADLGKLTVSGAAVAAPAAVAVKTAAQKQDTIRDIAITGDMSAADEAKLSLAVRNIARDSNQYQTDVLQGMQVLVAGGVQSREELEGYGAVLAKAATATRASMDDLGATTLALRDNLGITAKDLNASFNILASAGKAGNVELKDMAKFFPQMAPTMASMGVTGKEAVAQIAAALEVARKGAGTNDEAATNMRNFLQKIFAPDTVKNFSDAGIDLQASLKQLAKDGIGPFEGSMRLVMEYLRSKSPAAAAEFQKAMEVKDEAERAQTLSRISEAYALSDLFRDMQAMNFLRPMMMQMEEYRRIKAEALEAADKDVIGEDYGKRMATAVEQGKRLRVEFDLAAESLGNALLPSALAVGESLLPLLSRGANWIEQNQETVAAIAKLAAGLLLFRGGLLAVRLGFSLLGGPLVSAAVKFMTFRSLLAGGVRPTQALFRLFGMSPRAAALFAGGMGRAGGAVRSLGTLLLRAGRFSGGALVRGFALGGRGAALLGSGSLKLGRALSGPLVKGVSLAGKAILWLGRALLLNPVGLLVTGIGLAAYLIYKNWDRVKAAFSAGWNWLKGLGFRLLSWGKLLGPRLFPGGMAVKYVAENWDSIKAKFSAGLDWLKGLGPRLMQQGRELVASLFPEGGIGPALEAGWNTVKAKFQSGIAYIKGLPGQFLDMGKNVASGLVDGLKSGIGAAGDAIAGMAESVKNKFKGWLGIASPSKVFAGYGLNVAQGAALGIKAGEGEAAGAAAGLAKATAGGWTPPELEASLSGGAVPQAAQQAVSLPVEADTTKAGEILSRLATWGKRLFSGLFPVPAFPGMAAGMMRESVQPVRLERPELPELPAAHQAVKLTPPAPLKPEFSPLAPTVDTDTAQAALSRLAAWGRKLFAGVFPVPAFLEKAAGMARPETSAAWQEPDRQAESGWRPPRLLTAPDGPAKIAAAAGADRERGLEGRAQVNVTFSPNITIQGNATEKDVRSALSLTLPELERMMRRLMHDEQRRAYV